MRFESQTHPQDDHIDRYSTRYRQAPAVKTHVRLAKGRWKGWTAHNSHQRY